MPAAKNIEEKYINGIKVDKEDDKVFFNDETHTYYDKKTLKKYISVTTLINAYSQEFDEEFWSAYKALEELMDGDKWSIVKPMLLNTKKVKLELLPKWGINEEQFKLTQDAIKAEYKRKRDESCDRGTKIHEEFEMGFYNNKKFDFELYKLPNLCGEFECRQNYYKLDLKKGVYPELLLSCIFDNVYISGQIDLCIVDDTDVYIIDHKGLSLDTPILTKNGWSTMGDVSVGDIVFDMNGNQTKILNTSEIHYNPCYKITFDNKETIIADCDHRWLISFNRGKNKPMKTVVMTTKELSDWLSKHKRTSYNIPKILNAHPLNLPEKNLPIDPYVLGVWLGDGSKNCGVVTNITKEVWDEIKRRGYEIGDNLNENGAEEHTILGLCTELKKLNLIGNKHIPDCYLLASYNQRLDLLRGLMDTDGYLNMIRKRFVMNTSQEWQAIDLASLVSSLGYKPTIMEVVNHCDGKDFPGWNCCWSGFDVNPFLVRKQEEFAKIYCEKDNNSFRNIESVEKVDTVPTRCIEVDSETHTYLAGKNLIVTHNTNKEIKKHSFFDSRRKKRIMMKAPLQNLEDCSWSHYCLQLSLYAYMIETLYPHLKIKELKINHIDHNDVETILDVPYLKDDVQRMIKDYSKKLRIKEQLDRNEPYKLG